MGRTMATTLPTQKVLEKFNISEIHDAFLGKHLNYIDVLVVVAYFLSVLAVGLWAMWRTNRSTVGGYFLAGRSVLWWPVGASLFSSNVGSGHFIGLAGSGAANGIAVGAYEWNAMFVVLLLGWVFLPVYIASGVITMPGYMYKRFGGKRIQMCISVIYLFIYIFTKISVDLYAGAIFINQALKLNLYYSVLALLFVTAVYTIGGGLAAVIYTDTLQTVIMLVGAFVLMIVGFVDIGGYTGLVESYMTSAPTFRLTNHSQCGLPRNDSFHVFRSVGSNLPWTGVVFGMPILSVWYWCTDQVIVQRTLAAKNITHAKAGTILCSYLKVFPMFLIVMTGMISRAKFPDQVGCVVPEICSAVCENRHSCSDIAYPKLVMELLPSGARGLMMAVMLSALMSSLTSIFNSSSTIFTMDIWNRFRSKSSEWELMIVGRVFVFALVVLSIVWIPIIQAEEGGELFTYIQKISAYLQPPIAACFVLGIIWKRITEAGAFWGLCLGTLAGIIRLIVDFVRPDLICGEGEDELLVSRDIHYLHFAILLFLFTTVVICVISFFTQPWPDDVFGGLTWWTRHDMLSNDPMHLGGPSRDTEQSQLVSNDVLNENILYGNPGPVPLVGGILGEENKEFEDTPIKDIDLGNFSNLNTPLQRDNALPRHISASYDGSGVQFQEAHPDGRDVITTSEFETDERKLWRKILSFLCGFEQASMQPRKKVIPQKIDSLSEDPFWKKVVNINAVVCIMFSISLWIAFR